MIKQIHKKAFIMAATFATFSICSFLSFPDWKDATERKALEGQYAVSVDLAQKNADYNLKSGMSSADEGMSVNLYVGENYGIHKVYLNGHETKSKYVEFDRYKMANKYTFTMPAEKVTVTADILEGVVVKNTKKISYKVGAFKDVGDEIPASKLDLSGVSFYGCYITPDMTEAQELKVFKIDSSKLIFKVAAKDKNVISVACFYEGVSGKFLAYETKKESANTGTNASKDKVNNQNNQNKIVKPGKMSIRKISSKKRAISVQFKKMSNVKGYNVYMSTKKGSGYKKIATLSASKTSIKISKFNQKKLTKKKKYYVKVRAYKVVSGKKIYGAYSKVASVKCK